MRLAISNIAWNTEDDPAVADLLNANAVDAIDIAPGKYFPDFDSTDIGRISAVRDRWAARGIEITGMQSLLFGTAGLNVFGDADSQKRLLAHLTKVAAIAQILGATRLVFGSPKNRDRSGLDDETAAASATEFFRRAGDIMAKHGAILCLEPNPPRYGANFMTTTGETAAIVHRISHDAIRLQFDTGALTINGEDSGALLAEHAPIIGHIHASEPDLVTLGDGSTDHAGIAPHVRRHLADRIVCIEMTAPTTALPDLSRLEQAIRLATGCYAD